MAERGSLGFLAGFGDRGGPGRHHVGDAVIEPVLAAHDQVRTGEALRPYRVLDQTRAAAGAEPLANRLSEAAVDRFLPEFNGVIYGFGDHRQKMVAQRRYVKR